MTQQKLPAKTKLTVTLGVIGRLLKKVPRIAFFMLAFYAIFWVGTQLYYRFAPSENFLNYYYAKVDDTPVGTEPLMTLCRRVEFDGIKIDAYRTFIYYEAGGKTTQVAEYNFEANVEKGDGNCTNIRLKNQPQREGTYRAHTEYVFYVDGVKKAGQYDTNQYKMTPTALSLTAQIDALQTQIDALKAQLISQGETVPETPTVDDSDQSSSTSSPQGTSSNSQQSSTTPAQGSQSNTGNGSSQGSTPPPAPQVCTIDVIGIKLLCR